jgi:hypothetical protein
MINQLRPEYCYWNTWRTRIIVDEAMDTCDAFYIAWRSFSFDIQFNPLHWWYYKRWFVRPRCYPTAFGRVWDLKFELPSCEFEFSFIKWNRG